MRRTAMTGRLLWATVRCAPWSHVLAAGLIVGVLLWSPLRNAGGTVAGAVTWLRIVALALALGVTFWLDDVVDGLTTAVPCPAWLPRTLRALAVVPVLVGLMAGATWMVVTDLTRNGSTSTQALLDAARQAEVTLGWPLLLELAVMVLLGWTVALAAVRAGQRHGGWVAGPVLMVAAVVAQALPASLRLVAAFAPASDTRDPAAPAAWAAWQAAHLRLAVVFAGLLAVGAVLASDPARRWWPRLRRHPARLSSPSPTPRTGSTP